MKKKFKMQRSSSRKEVGQLVNQHVESYFIESVRKTPKQPATEVQVLMAILRAAIPNRWLPLGALWIVDKLYKHLNGKEI